MEKGTISELLYVHIQNTSAHGLPNMLRAKTLLGKLMWFFLFVAGIGALTWQIADRLNRFFSNEYDVKLEINFSKEVPFPAVTFCNMNPLRTSELRASSIGRLSDILQAYDVPPGDSTPQENNTPPNNPADMPNPDNNPEQAPDMKTTPGPPKDSPPDPPPISRRKRQLPVQMMTTQMTPEDMTTEGVQSWDNRVRPEFFSQRADEHLIREMMANELSRLNVGEKSRLGHQLRTMLLKCEWQGYSCAPDNFTEFFNSQYGNCYTFGRNSDELRANHPGPANGLSLELFIEHEEYLRTLTDTAGIVLVVHESDKMPLPEDDGIQISTGFNTAVGIRQTCERSCYQEAVVKTCSCADSSYPFVADDQLAEPCNTVEHTNCRKAVALSYRAGDITCDCFNPCEETKYIPSISVAYWPSDVVKEGIYDDIKRTNQEARSFLLREADPSEWLEKNVAKVQIFFQEFNYETITQNPAYTLGDLLSDVGGQLGLWLGISVLSIFEIIETISAVVALLWYGLKHSGKLKKIPSTPLQVIKPPIRPTMSDSPQDLFPSDDGKHI
ncbi:Amiloride-sensitive sodium channel subunit gamma [Holothuria leucospilota]|uniref:Amiloride-sensitive sodium channel subunit gamma n=1 Tax=Holothuria leucospilota TaxID=206669 RepID=A0A9Q1BNQ1_HOLLE|nr:Amiloride-sensitive sodium channel subunit gamma [Holothuria leucospilota]